MHGESDVVALAGEALGGVGAVGGLEIGGDVAQKGLGFTGGGECAWDEEVEPGEFDFVDEALALEEGPWVEPDVEKAQGEQWLFDAGAAGVAAGPGSRGP